MITLLLRTVIVYLLVFGVIRLMGKRQISDMQPFDLVITLLIADLASSPISDGSIPLLYGVIPILTLFILHRLAAFTALRSEPLRKLMCGNSIVIIDNGIVNSRALHAANYTVSDLMEQLRIKDVFSFSEVKYAILETNGSLSVLKENELSSASEPSVLLAADGKPDKRALTSNGITESELNSILKKTGIGQIKDCLYVCLESPESLLVQYESRKKKPRVKNIDIVRR